MYWGAGVSDCHRGFCGLVGEAPGVGTRGSHPACSGRGAPAPIGEDLCAKPEAQSSVVACARPHRDVVNRAICYLLSLVLWLLLKVASEYPLPQGTLDGISWGWELFALDTGSAHLQLCDLGQVA